MKKRTTAYVGLDVRELARAGGLEPGARRSSSDFPGGLQTLMRPDDANIELRFWHAGAEWVQRQPLTFTPCNYGSRRPWFLCDCGRKAAILYPARGAWICRQCARLDYQTQHEDRFERGYWRMKAVHRRLGSPWPDDGSLTLFPPVPDRPRGMHTGTDYRLLLRLARIQRSMFRDIEEMAAQLTALGE